MKMIRTMLIVPLLMLVCSLFAAGTASAYTDGLMSADFGYSSPALMPSFDVAAIAAPVLDPGENSCHPVDSVCHAAKSNADHTKPSGGTAGDIAYSVKMNYGPDTGVRLQV